MPWVAAAELMSAMGLTRGQQTAANSILKDPKHGARIGTSKGFTNIISFSNAKGLIKASVHIGYVSASFEEEYARPLFAAARMIHPELFEQDDETDEWIIHSSALARLMGQDHEDLTDLI
jgi:hypothetical protein